MHLDTYSLENILKGSANHRRIEVLFELKSTPDMSVEELAEATRSGYKTLSAHLKRLVTSGLITKNYYGRRVEHRLTERGTCVVDFIRTLS